MASLPPHAASESTLESTGTQVYTAMRAKEEQLVNLILKQIYKIVGGFTGSQWQWLPGEPAAAPH